MCYILYRLLEAFTAMEDPTQDHPNSPSHGSERVEPIRSRWTPKPEQILILESIFNSGMVNPPKEETVKIRKLLEKFGSVGDANVFYWFQNRRSRSRRRQRQIQASLEQKKQGLETGGAIRNEASASSDKEFGSSSSSSFSAGSSSSSSYGVKRDDMNSFFPVSSQLGFHESEQSFSVTPAFCHSSDSENFHFQHGLMLVYINGVATEVPKGPLNVKSVFGEDAVLVHASGVPVPVNDYGFLDQTLHDGESYFLVSRAAWERKQ